LPFRPGLAGGHCISVDPYYLLHRARVAQVEPKLVATARLVNEQVVERVAEKVVEHLAEVGVPLAGAKVLVKGVSFKGNVADIRNSKILEVVKLLKEQGVQVDLEDPLVNNSHLKKEVGWELSSKLSNNYEVVIVAADHSVYNNLGEDYFCGISGPQALIMDLKGMFQGKVTQRKYWSL
jgi:UDP-N-acetyl-D-galactosamine dehydrogenase